MLAEQPFEVTWSAVVVRKDGSREDLGVIARTVVPRRSLWASLGRIVGK